MHGVSSLPQGVAGFEGGLPAGISGTHDYQWNLCLLLTLRARLAPLPSPRQAHLIMRSHLQGTLRA